MLRVDRFSPYYLKPAEYGIGTIYPKKVYEHIYPFPPESLARLAYFFESDLLNQKKDGTGAHVVATMVKRWQKAHGSSFLLAIPRRKSLLIIDTRRSTRRWVHRLTGLRRAVYEYCDRAHGLADITRELGASAALELIEEAVESLVRDRLMLASGRRYLSLGIKQGETRTFVFAPTKSTAASRFRKYRRSLRDRWTRRAVLGLGRLLQEPEQHHAPVTRLND